VAVDGYNWGASQSWSTWKSPADTFGNMIGRVRALTSRPLALTEFASTSETVQGTSVAAKSQWIADLFTYVASAGIKMICWFNTDKETDWAMFGGGNGDTVFKVGRTSYKAYVSYKTGVASGTVVPSNPSNPQLITDDQFAGH